MDIIEIIKAIILERLNSDVGWILIICMLLSVGQACLGFKVNKLEESIEELKKKNK